MLAHLFIAIAVQELIRDELHISHQEIIAAEQLVRAGATVICDDRTPALFRPLCCAKGSEIDTFAGRRCGCFFDRVVQVETSATSLEAADLMLLDRFTCLSDLSIPEAELDDDALGRLSSLAQLESVDISASQVTDRSLVGCLASWLNIYRLDVSSTSVSDKTAVAIGNLSAANRLPWLSVLDLSRTGVTNLSCRHFAKCKNLTVLRLNDTDLSDEGVIHLSELRSLEKLELDNVGITVRAIDSLRRLRHLRLLSLNGTKCDDKWIDALSRLPLRDLYVGGTQLTDDGIRRLQQANAELRIHQ